MRRKCANGLIHPEEAYDDRDDEDQSHQRRNGGEAMVSRVKATVLVRFLRVSRMLGHRNLSLDG